MADTRERRSEPPRERADETSDTERQRIRSSNDRDQALEREGVEAPRNRGYDEATRGRDVDPDSAGSGVDRDDTVTEG